jgi:hypothetical protein
MLATFAASAQDSQAQGLLQAQEKGDLSHDPVPMLDLVVHHDDLFNGAASVMKQLFPEWKMEDITYVQFKDGITNKRKCFPLLLLHSKSSTVVRCRVLEQSLTLLM